MPPPYPAPLRAYGTSPSSVAPAPPGWRPSASHYQDAQRSALAWAQEGGWDQESLMELPVQWGEQDTFRHVNNVIYLRWFESGRIAFISALARLHAERQGKSHSEADVASAHMVQGKDVGVILAELSAKYKRPITFPDTVLVAHRVKADTLDRRRFELEGAVYSYSQKAVTTTSLAVNRWYDYDHLKVAECSEVMMDILRQKTGTTSSSSSKL